MTEHWKQIPGYEGFYEVSDMGSVRSVRRVVPHGRAVKTLQGRVLAPTAMKAGHLTVNLYRGDGKIGRKPQLVHRLVLLAFVGPCADDHEACHRNGDPTDNRLENLYWGTRAENVADCIRHGTHRWSGRSHCEKGHEFTPENTSIRTSHKGRICKTCARERSSAYKARLRAERGAVA